MKTYFETACDMIGAAYDSEAAEKLAELVNDLIFEQDWTDEEKIMKEAVKKFNKVYR